MSTRRFSERKQSFHQDNNMLETIELLTKMAEKDTQQQQKPRISESFKPPNLNRKSLTKNPSNKENNFQIDSKTERKPSIYSSKNSTAMFLKNVIFLYFL